VKGARSFVVLVVVAAAGACARTPPISSAGLTGAATTKSIVAPANAYDAKTLSSVSVLTTGHPLDSARAQQLSSDIGSGKLSFDTFVDELLKSPEFAYEVAPQMILKEATAYNVRVHEGLVLAHSATEAGEVYHWRGHPCAARDAVSVTPWWNLAQKVLVCPDAYRPDVFTTTNDRIQCSAAVGWGSQGVVRDRCGCGPYLIRCVRDELQRAEVSASVLGEATKTIGYVVEHDLPLSEAFVSPSTFRDRDAEFLLRRDAIERRETTQAPDLSQWPESGTYAPRTENYPGEHAGILTTPLIRWTQDAKRAVMKMVFDLVWCIPPSSIGVTADAILNLGTGDVRAGNVGQQELAKMPVCTGCHARLDSATKFFTSFADSGFALYSGARPRSAGTGPLYALDISDERGDAELTPREFATLAVQQPEFPRCMAQDIGAHIFGEGATTTDLDSIRSTMAQQKTLRAGFREGLVRWVSRSSERHREFSATPASAGEQAGDSVAVNPALRAELDAHCSACHDGDPNVSFVQPAISRRTMIEMLNRVSFKTMPKGQPLSNADREGLLTTMIESLWSEPAARQRAEAYFLRWDRAGRALGIGTSLGVLRSRVGAPSSSKPPATVDALIGGEYRQLTPGYATVLALQALEMCRAAGLGEGAARERCLSHALITDDYVLPDQ
jgi:hypothetical protein